MTLLAVLYLLTGRWVAFHRMPTTTCHRCGAQDVIDPRLHRARCPARQPGVHATGTTTRPGQARYSGR